MHELITAAAWAAALLLGVAGVAKLRRPSATTATLQAASLPSHPALVRVLGLAELLLAVALLAAGGRAPAALLAAAYLAFAVFSARHRSRPGARCGCFGESSAPLGRRHVVVDVAVTALLSVAIIWPVAPISVLAAGDVLPGALAAVTVSVAAWLLRLHLTDAVALDAAVADSRGGTT